MKMKISEALKLISAKERGHVHQRRDSRRINRLEEIFELIKKNPGIKQCELTTRLKLHHSNVSMYVLSLCADGRIERIYIGHTYKLYIKGTIQDASVKSRRPAGHWQENSLINKAHGEAFFKAFDEAFGILYIDLKIIAGACDWSLVAPARTGIDRDDSMPSLPVCGVIPQGVSFHQGLAEGSQSRSSRDKPVAGALKILKRKTNRSPLAPADPVHYTAGSAGVKTPSEQNSIATITASLEATFGKRILYAFPLSNPPIHQHISSTLQSLPKGRT